MNSWTDKTDYIETKMKIEIIEIESGGMYLRLSSSSSSSSSSPSSPPLSSSSLNVLGRFRSKF
ncbi:hypothetical protein QR98_0012820 [Sarcoptes scabiei]|uniref:Uncharacterized protein n=1 Tax=Sarcoptes scabiei TaxID=52283 RepID=A0A131ZVK5_SARSC|nr:hypothetical protein QR98_0012820 [Sarcoptes scabiei]